MKECGVIEKIIIARDEWVVKIYVVDPTYVEKSKNEKKDLNFFFFFERLTISFRDPVRITINTIPFYFSILYTEFPSYPSNACRL